MVHQTAGILSIVRRQTHAAHEIGKPGIAAQWYESFMIEQHSHAAITSLECQLQSGKSMILFSQSHVDSSNVHPGRAVRLSFLDDISKNFSGLFDSAGLPVHIGEHASINRRFRRGLHGLLKLLHGFGIFSVCTKVRPKRKWPRGKLRSRSSVFWNCATASFVRPLRERIWPCTALMMREKGSASCARRIKASASSYHPKFSKSSAYHCNPVAYPGLMTSAR